MPGLAAGAAAGGRAICSRGACADAVAAQSPISEDRELPHTKAPRMVKWKMDRLW